MGADRTSPGKECPIIWRGRRAKAFVPSMLDVRSIDLSSVTRSRTAVAAAEISSTAASMPSGHVPLARLLLRAEGVASSYLEGVTAPITDIVMAEADGGELATPAGLVASNFAAITSAVDSAGDELTTEMLCAWQRTVVHGSPLPSRYVGVIRDEQGWIGGTSPLDAALVTSPPDRLPGLLEDLVGYSNRSDLDPVAQAAIVHAQFEIIHPFAVIGARQARRILCCQRQQWPPNSVPAFARRQAHSTNSSMSAFSLCTNQRAGVHRGVQRCCTSAPSCSAWPARTRSADPNQPRRRLSPLWHRPARDGGSQRRCRSPYRLPLPARRT